MNMYHTTQSMHSPEVEAIMKLAPAKLMKYGTVGFLAVIGLTFSICWMIKYPTVVRGDCIVYVKQGYALGYIEQVKSGNVAFGQQANLKLEAYPFRQFDVLQGKVIQVDNAPDSRGLLSVKIALIEGPTFNPGFRPNRKEKLNGTAEIITKKTRLLDRFCESMHGVFNKF